MVADEAPSLSSTASAVASSDVSGSTRLDAATVLLKLSARLDSICTLAAAGMAASAVIVSMSALCWIT